MNPYADYPGHCSYPGCDKDGSAGAFFRCHEHRNAVDCLACKWWAGKPATTYPSELLVEPGKSELLRVYPDAFKRYGECRKTSPRPKWPETREDDYCADHHARGF